MGYRPLKPFVTEIDSDPVAELPESRSEWPAAAREAYSRLLAELNAWSRANRCSSSFDSWIAETGVREAWHGSHAAVLAEPSRVAA